MTAEKSTRTGLIRVPKELPEGVELILAVSFLDHHSWEANSTSGARDLSSPTLITIFGRPIYEDATTLMVESVHLDRAHPEYSGEQSVHHQGWAIIKSAIVAKKKLGLWKHPESPQ